MSKDNELTKQNAIIEEIGYFFCGHSGSGLIRVQLQLSKGGKCAFEIWQPKLIKNFISIFSSDVDEFEDGFYIEELKGKHICGWFDSSRRIVGVSDILDEDGEDIVLFSI